MTHHPATWTMLAALVLSGCGGSGTPSEPPASTSAPPASNAPPSNVAANSGPAKAGGSTAKKPEVASKKAQVPPGAMLVGGSEPNFAVLPRELRGELQHFVVNPDPGINSSLVTVVTEASPPTLRSPAAPLPAGFIALPETGVDASGFPKQIRGDKDGAVMALIPAGLAVQGADGASPNASPRHPIDLDAYYIDVNEVTVEKFQKFIAANKGEKATAPPPSNASFPLQPALGIIWRDAMLYAKWAGKELPTESEWEKAARGTKGFSFPWGEGRPIWERKRAPGQIDDVGSFRTDESVYGVFDLSGNAREWCHDFYAEDAYRRSPAGGSAAAKNWAGPRTADKSGRRVVKGNRQGWDLWAREGLSMTDRSQQIGFRCVLRLTSGAPSKTPVAEKTSPPATVPAGREQPAPAPKAVF